MRADHCTLHIGMAKTGTTSLQATLAANRARLQEADLLYPALDGADTDQLRLFASCFHDPAGVRGLRMRGAGTARAAAEATRVLSDALTTELAASGCSRLILSSEFLSNHAAGLDMAALTDLLAHFAASVTVVCYVRDPRHLAVSMSQQGVAEGARGWDQCFEPPLPRMAERLGPFLATFGRAATILRRFDRDTMPDGDVCQDFLGTMGVDRAIRRDLTPVRVNETLSLEGALIAGAFNSRQPETHSGTRNPARARRLQHVFRTIPGERYGLSAATLARLEERLHPDLTWLAEHADIDFREDPSPDPAGAPAWHRETLAGIGSTLNDLARQAEDDRDRCDAAATALRQGVAEDAPAPAVRDALAALGDTETAEAVANRLVTTAPDDPHHQKRLSELAAANGCMAKAVAAARNAVAAAGDDAAVVRHAALLLADHGTAAEALPLLDRAAAHYPGDAAVDAARQRAAWAAWAAGPADATFPGDPVDGVASLLAADQTEAAARVAETACARHGEEPSLLRALAAVRARQGRIRDSIALNARALGVSGPEGQGAAASPSTA